MPATANWAVWRVLPEPQPPFNVLHGAGQCLRGELEAVRLNHAALFILACQTNRAQACGFLYPRARPSSTRSSMDFAHASGRSYTIQRRSHCIAASMAVSISSPCTGFHAPWKCLTSHRGQRTLAGPPSPRRNRYRAASAFMDSSDCCDFIHSMYRWHGATVPRATFGSSPQSAVQSHAGKSVMP